jgi:5-carboxymethyl-2-hydroxymuconate isomerase
MPHIIIEYSQDSLASTTLKSWVDGAFETVKATGLFKSDNIKVRAHPVMDYRLGLPDSGFIHVMCRIHAGKTDVQKLLLSQSLLVSLQNGLSEAVVITVEVIEMDEMSYSKKVLSI